MSVKKPKFRRQFDLSYKGCKGELNEQESVTVPDQNISLRKLLHNHTRNIPSPQVKMREPIYFETEIPVIEDLNDVNAYKDQVAAWEEDVKGKFEEEVTAAREKALEEAKEKAKAELYEESKGKTPEE